MVRTSNEDSCVANMKSEVFVVADGMGGHAAGEIASHIAAAAVDEVISGRGPESNMEDLLKLAVQTANTRVYETQKLKPEYRGMGSTMTALAFMDNHYYLAHVGDSRAYLLRDKALNQLTRDHSLVWPLYESKIVAKDDLSRHPQKNLITKSIGTHPEVEADLQHDVVFGGDIFLLCSDGLTDVLSDRDILDVLAGAEKNPQNISELLISAANAAGGPDNVTAIVICLASS
jgi:serine/threonine protein phosphatase PrpC